MNKTETIKNLRIEYVKECNLYFVCIGEGLTYRCFSSSVSEKAAKNIRAAIRKDPQQYGIETYKDTH